MSWTCEAVQELLSDHLEGALAPDEADGVGRHLDGCSRCRAEADGLREVVAALRRTPRVELPTDLMARVRSALEREAAVPPPAMGCDEVEDCLTAHLEGDLEGWEGQALGAHLAGCVPCRRRLHEVEAVITLLRSVPRPLAPDDLVGRVRSALRAETAGGPAPVALARVSPARGWRPRWSHLASSLAGAAVACFVFLAWTWLPGVGLPRIEAAAVAVRQDVAVNIAFDLDKRVEGVVFQVDLPEGLQFLDERSQPMLAQSVSWRGTLEKGRTVVPIVVRGVRPGRYAIEAYVRKGPLKRRTTVVLPVEG